MMPILLILILLSGPSMFVTYEVVPTYKYNLYTDPDTRCDLYTYMLKYGNIDILIKSASSTGSEKLESLYCYFVKVETETRQKL